MMSCPTELELDQAVSMGADPVLTEHLARCEACRTAWEEIHRVIALASELTVALPSADQREERRTAMLAAWNPLPSVKVLLPAPDEVIPAPARTPPRAKRMQRVAIGMAVAAVLAGLSVVVRSEKPAQVAADPHPRRGVVHAHEGARFTLAAQPPDEMVRLRDGVVDIDVDPLLAGERFRVVVGTDEVEVRGTSFEVVAVDDKLVAVHVVHGRVEVKRVGTAAVVLTNGESWQAPTDVPPSWNRTPAVVPAPPAPPAPSKPPPSPPTVIPAPAPPDVPAKPTADPQEAAFVLGWDALRQGEYGKAAAAFNRAIALAPDGPLSEDALFWHAVAVARLHRTAEAIAGFRAFLDAFPASTRAGEASAMLGWLLIETHEFDEARRRFHAVENDPNASARASALQGLATVGSKQP